MNKTATKICIGKTHQKHFPYHSSPCSNKAWRDGYCKIHHPEERTRKQRVRDAKKNALRMKAESPTATKTAEEIAEEIMQAGQFGGSQQACAILIKQYAEQAINEILNECTFSAMHNEKVVGEKVILEIKNELK